MSHIRKPLGFAVGLNTAVFVLEMVAGLRAHSLSLVMDAVHNLSDELALVCLFCAYLVTLPITRGLQRSANVLNSLGLVVVGTLVIWQAAERMVHPHVVVGWLPVVAGLLAAAGNWGVARALAPWQASNATIRLAYLHNLGDTYVSLAPVAAGLLVLLFRRSYFDPAIAVLIGSWIVLTTLLELRRSTDELLWPSEATCPHGEHAAA
ncbi:MAG TPA: cation transporter [Gemmatimonadales bacterium]|jgi:cobalt-zinc-cadmium efflux system protein